MLRELHISNLAVIEDARLELDEGLNCFTGQTGAGKSVVVGAFELLLGLRSAKGGQMLRPGAEEARVCGVFELRDASIREQVARAADLAPQDTGEILITRRIFASGRTSASINGQPATSGMIRTVGELLVDVHGQHEHQYLLRPANQLRVLDAFADTVDQRDRFSELHARLRVVKQAQEDLEGSRSLRHQELDLARFQAGEIDAADLVADEFQDLQIRHRRLSNTQRLLRDAGTAHAALYDSEGSVLERLQAIVHVLGDLVELDADLEETREQVRTATLSLQDSAFDLGRYVNRLEANPRELAQIEDRLNTINRLVAKYPGGTDHQAGPKVQARRAAGPRDEEAEGPDPVADVLAYRDRLESQITRLAGQDTDLGDLAGERARLETELDVLARQLTKGRKAAAARLGPLVESQLRELGMADAGFQVEFAQDPTSPWGRDQIEMLVRTNPGHPARPMRTIASGGELSRIMLALKTIFARGDRVSVLVFDEIDANIGGRMGTVIGTKLRQLCGDGREKGGHQVLCITHLPQIAAFADHHVRIAKTVVGRGRKRQTVATVSALTAKQRVDELAEMLAGKEATATTRKQARELLNTAR